eukprot:15444627-Alexandrium_andersonii.AAC.1
MRMRDASSRVRIVKAQSMSEALANQMFAPFTPKGAGSEAQKGSRAQRVVPNASASRAPKLFLARSPAGGG